MITLGNKVKDSITGFEGIAIARIEYLNGCVSFEVRPLELKDGLLQDTEWIDDQQLDSSSESPNGGVGNRPSAFSTPK